MPFHRLTRRQALKLGAATAALGALRASPSALAAPRPEAFTLELPAADAAAAGWRTSQVFDAPRRFDLIGLGWRRGGGVDAQVRARRHGGRWSRWTHLHDAGDHGPDAGRAAAGTDPAWTGAADQFQLRLRGHARGLHARFVRSGPAARATRSLASTARRRQIPGAPVIIPRARLGRRCRAPALRAVLRPGPTRVRAPHGQHERLRAGGLGGDRARDRQVPPRPPRLERRRLQLPRRPVRPDLRGPRGRRRPGDRRRAGAGLQQRLDRRRVHRHLHRRSPRPRPEWTHSRGSSAGSSRSTRSPSPAR